MDSEAGSVHRQQRNQSERSAEGRQSPERRRHTPTWTSGADALTAAQIPSASVPTVTSATAAEVTVEVLRRRRCGKWCVLASEHDRPGRYPFYRLAGEEPPVSVVLSGWTDAGVADSDMTSTLQRGVALTRPSAEMVSGAHRDSFFGPFRVWRTSRSSVPGSRCRIGVGEPILHCH